MVRLRANSSICGMFDQLCFNSNMVRLRDFAPERFGGERFSFNSNMVRLREVTKNTRTVILVFQFQYGAIKSQPEGLTAQETSGFNSNMVRLRENPDGTHRGLINQFQFQYGAIKRIGS